MAGFSAGELISSVTALTQHMLDAARASEWDAVIESERQRDPQLQQIAALVSDANHDASVITHWRQALQFMIESDREVTQLVELYQHDIAREMSRLGESRKAVNAYLDNSSL